MMKSAYRVNLSDKTAVITGGGGVLCSCFAQAIADCGANVAILDLNLDKAQAVAGDILASGGKAVAVKADVLDPHSLNDARQAVAERFGACDILINGAGGNSPKATTDDEFYSDDVFNDINGKSFFDLDASGFSMVFGLNMTGTLMTTQVFARDMLAKRDGVIINISSMNAFTPLTKIPAYSAAKSAVTNFTQWLAVYFAQTGIRVNAIAPGFFSTQQNKTLLFNDDGTLTERSKKILNNTPMRRFGEPEELNGTLLWLVDKDASGFVTGINVPVDGGFSAYSGV